MKTPIPTMNPKQARNALALIAEQEIGVREEGGPNRGPRIREYQGATWLEPDSWPWCAAFICWIIREWLKAEPVRVALKLTKDEGGMWRPRTAGAFDFVNWAKKKGLKVLTNKEPCMRGDIIVFNFNGSGHIGLSTADRSPAQPIETVDGNTNGLGSREGDGVYRKERKRSVVKAIIRIL